MSTDRNLRYRERQRVAQALRAAGYEVNNVYDLVNSSDAYPQAIPVLLELMPTVQEAAVKEGVVRALAVKEAINEEVSRALIREFLAIYPTAPSGGQSLKWAIANTLSVVARDDVFDEIATLALDRRHGQASQMLTEALARMKNPGAADVLMEMLENDEVAGHAVYALGKLKVQAAESKIEPFLDHPREWVRKEAQRALAKIEKARVREEEKQRQKAEKARLREERRNRSREEKERERAEKARRRAEERAAKEAARAHLSSIEGGRSRSRFPAKPRRRRSPDKET